MAVKSKLPIGIERFEEIRTKDFYYVDKTGFIRDLLHNWGKVNLFTRPRRFGKSLNMSMLKNFLEIGCDRTLFEGLEISGETALCEEYMGKFPVISITFKSVNGNSYDAARAMMCSIIGKEAMRFQFLLESDRLTEREKEMYRQLIEVNGKGGQAFYMEDSVLAGSLQTLSLLLQKHYEKEVVLLVDEYDVPLSKAFDNGYYDQMVFLIRSILEQVLKTNDSLYFSVLTGCLRITKESIFTGLNNMKVLSITDVRFEEYFGFTDREVRELLEYYELSEYYDVVKSWYDGYQFGNVQVYCPWDVISYCDVLRSDRSAQPEEYWSNTSDNEVIRHFLEMATPTAKQELENLMAGETVTKEIRQELTYKDLYDSIDNMWSVLFTTGYLTQRGAGQGRKLPLAIPNTEIRNIFANQITSWFQDTARQEYGHLGAFCEAFQRGDAEAVERQFQMYLRKTISIRDTEVRKERKENFYHGILLGLLSSQDTWKIASNRESGDGYADIQAVIQTGPQAVMQSKSQAKTGAGISPEMTDGETGILIEIKYAENGNLEESCQEALEQIEQKRYDENLRDEGIQTIWKYGIACYKKRCRVAVVKG